MRIPPVVKTLLLLNIAMFLLDMGLQAGGIQLNNLLGLWYVGSPYFHLFQLVTYMFMHGNLTHIFFNMFALWMFGRIMEQVWGGQRFLIYYLVCGIGAGIVQELGQVMGLIYAGAMTIGASGAVYGILLAFGLTFPNERLIIFPLPIPIKAKYFVAFYALIELFEGFSSADGVAHFAHLGGMLFGLILILYWRKHARGRSIGGGNFWKSTTTYSSDPGAGQYRRQPRGSNYDRGEDSLWTRLKHAVTGKSGQSARGDDNAPAGRADDYAYNARKRAENDEIDRILEKIRKGGYASLTTEEKKRLFDASKQ